MLTPFSLAQCQAVATILLPSGAPSIRNRADGNLPPAEHRLFFARADWRDAEQYPQEALYDPSIGAWELLRRNSEYNRGYGTTLSRTILYRFQPALISTTLSSSLG